MRSFRFGWAAGAMALAAVTLGFLFPSDGEAAFGNDKNLRRRIMGGVVFLLAANVENGELQPLQAGSGTVITEAGHILTNHHVIWDERNRKYTDAVAVAVLKAFDQSPVPVCLAVPKNGIVKPDLDLALLKCELDLQGKPLNVGGWPMIPVGNSQDLVPGDDIWVLGFPGIGQGTIHVTAGKVSGFTSDKGGGGRDWIKTDAAIAHGNSGGTAVDEEGRLVGVPTARILDKENDGASAGSMGLIRPIELATDLVQAAAGGWQPGERQGGPGPQQGQGCFGCGKKQPGQTQPSGGVTVLGQVVASDNGAPIANAFVIIFKPGVKVAELNKDNLGEKYLTKATTNRNGQFAMEQPIPRGKRFTVIVYADGYEMLAENAVLSTEDANVPDRYEPWDSIKLDRE